MNLVLEFEFALKIVKKNSDVINVSRLWLNLKQGTDWHSLSKTIFMNLPLEIEIISFSDVLQSCHISNILKS